MVLLRIRCSIYRKNRIHLLVLLAEEMARAFGKRKETSANVLRLHNFSLKYKRRDEDHFHRRQNRFLHVFHVWRIQRETRPCKCPASRQWDSTSCNWAVCFGATVATAAVRREEILAWKYERLAIPGWEIYFLRPWI